jgi:dienelactone hydrolase
MAARESPVSGTRSVRTYCSIERAGEVGSRSCASCTDAWISSATCSGSSKVNAAIDCWGGFIHRAAPDAETTPARPAPILDLVKNLHCLLFAVCGEEDQNPTVASEAELKQRATASGKAVATKIYKDAGHAFLADHRPSYREKPAFELWTDITD